MLIRRFLLHSSSCLTKSNRILHFGIPSVCELNFTSFLLYETMSDLSAKTEDEGDESLFCDLCKKEVQCEDHFSLEHDSRLYKCEECGIRLVGKEFAQKHMKGHGPGLSAKRERVKKESTEKLVLVKKETDKKPIILQTENEQQTIIVKKETYKKRNKIKKDSDANTDVYCKICNVKVESKDHFRRKHDERLFECDICGDHIKGKVNINNHKRMHEMYTCPKCNIVFQRKNRGRHDLQCFKSENSKIFQCQICPYNTVRSDSFTRHEKSHIKRELKIEKQRLRIAMVEKKMPPKKVPDKCPYCDYESRYSNVKRHIKDGSCKERREKEHVFVFI